MSKGIYAYFDNENNKFVYVGKDSYIHRNSRHKDHYRLSKYYAQSINSILQNNPDRYSYKKLWETNDCSDDELNQKEIDYIKRYNPKFNFTKGGEGTIGLEPWNKNKVNVYSEKIKKSMRENTSKANTTTGLYRVYKSKDKKCWQGFIWVYSYFENGKNSKRKSITSTNLEDLKNKVKSQGLCWKIMDEEKAKQSFEEHKEKYRDDKNTLNTTGFYRVSKKKGKKYSKGYTWVYRYNKNGKRKTISSIDLKMLQKKIEEKKLLWKIIDEEKAKKSLRENEVCI